MAQWKNMNVWEKVGLACDRLSIAVLMMSFGYATIMKGQIPQNTWVVALLLFTMGRDLGGYNHNWHRIMDERAAAPQNG